MVLLLADSLPHLPPTSIEVLTAHMAAEGFLERVDDVLGVGQQTGRRYGGEATTATSSRPSATRSY